MHDPKCQSNSNINSKNQFFLSFPSHFRSPTTQRALCTYGRSKGYVIFCVVFAILYNLVKFFEAQVLAYDHPVYGTIYCVLPTEFRQDPTYITIYIHWCYLVVNYFIPFYGLLIFNLLIWSQVRKANRERQMLSRTEKREIGLATMLLCVVVVFFLFNVLALYVNIREAFFGDIPDKEILISNLLVTLNSSVNFIIYVIFGEKFKRIFLQMLCSGRIGRESPDGLMHDDSSFSNGDPNRCSGRFSRHGTQRGSTRNGSSMKTTRTMSMPRAPSPGPCVYYPAREATAQTTIEISKNGFDWEIKNGIMSSGLL